MIRIWAQWVPFDRIDSNFVQIFVANRKLYFLYHSNNSISFLDIEADEGEGRVGAVIFVFEISIDAFDSYLLNWKIWTWYEDPVDDTEMSQILLFFENLWIREGGSIIIVTKWPLNDMAKISAW